MKSSHMIFAYILLYSMLQTPLIGQHDLSEIGWLEGRWVSVKDKPDAMSYEIWTKNSGPHLQGVSYSIKASDTSFFESLEIRWRDYAFYYIADVPQNSLPVAFRITEMSDTSLIAENREHDFPTKIHYHRKGDELLVEISSDDRGRQFRFRKEED